MTGPTSHITPTREPRSYDRRWRRRLSLAFGAAFLGALFLFVEHFPESRLGRTIDAHLSQLANPASWTP